MLENSVTKVETESNTNRLNTIGYNDSQMSQQINEIDNVQIYKPLKISNRYDGNKSPNINNHNQSTFHQTHKISIQRESMPHMKS